MKHIEEDGYKFTLDSRSGYYLSSRKINGKRLRYHVYVWIKNKGPVPAGYAVHHKDENKENNTIENFVLISDVMHCSFHAKERMQDPERYAEQKENLNRIRQKASEWHASPEGREWHKKHYEKMGTKLYVKVTKTCKYCGKEYTTTMSKSLFCSNSCLQKYHYHNKTSCIEKTCQFCGKTFLGNKYRKTPYCGRSCAVKAKSRNALDKS